ncbi:MAG: response regulator transcription factor, partial [Rhodoferax sp.]|nr:response regulator transcription factor [Rhodoferax sp.]
ALQGRTHFDLLTLDLQLPGGSGLDVLQQVRQMRPDLRVMVLSADDSPDSMQRAMALGANTYLSKSVSERELFEALRAAV